jgi:hypothetical protein
MDALTLTHGSDTAASGGAIFNNGNDLTISNSILKDNQGYTGGAISTSGKLTLTTVVLTGNTAIGGGAIEMTGGQFTIYGSTFSGNRATGAPGISGPGGAIYFKNTASDQLLLRNSTISGNNASDNGGGLNLSNFLGEVLIQNCTIRDNTAGAAGGGIAMTTGTLSLESSVVSLNVAATASTIQNTKGTVNAKTCALGTATVITTFNDQGGNLAAGAALKLGPLANNGGFTQTHLPAPDSVLIDKGSNPAALTTDQRGTDFPREAPGKASPPTAPVADIGAVEVVPAGLIQGRVFGASRSSILMPTMTEH